MLSVGIYVATLTSLGKEGVPGGVKRLVSIITGHEGDPLTAKKNAYAYSTSRRHNSNAKDQECYI